VCVRVRLLVYVCVSETACAWLRERELQVKDSHHVVCSCWYLLFFISDLQTTPQQSLIMPHVPCFLFSHFFFLCWCYLAFAPAGIGFAKTPQQSLECLRDIRRFTDLCSPLARLHALYAAEQRAQRLLASVNAPAVSASLSSGKGGGAEEDQLVLGLPVGLFCRFSRALLLL
jgi:hypothetical protein